MFPLHTKTFPANATDLTRLMNESVRRVFIAGAEPVTIESASYPDRCRPSTSAWMTPRLRPDPPRPPSLSADRAPALQVEDLRVEGSRLSLGPAIAGLRLQARDVRLEQARDDQDEITLTRAERGGGRSGNHSRQIRAGESHRGRGQLGSRQTRRHDRRRQARPCANAARAARAARCRSRRSKLFFSTVIRITADLDLDEELNATISGLNCKGDGAIGALACGFLAPHLEKLDRRTFPLLALPLGEIRLRDVRLSAADKIVVRAEFGA